MTFNITKSHSIPANVAVHANGQAKMQVDYIPPTFGDVLNKAKVRALEELMGITFDKRKLFH